MGSTIARTADVFNFVPVHPELAANIAARLYAFLRYSRGYIAALSPKAVLAFRFRFCATSDVVRAGDTTSCN